VIQGCNLVVEVACARKRKVSAKDVGKMGAVSAVWGRPGEGSERESDGEEEEDEDEGKAFAQVDVVLG
jgi:hypothetical protein